jgi:hypothetical protein
LSVGFVGAVVHDTKNISAAGAVLSEARITLGPALAHPSASGRDVPNVNHYTFYSYISTAFHGSRGWALHEPCYVSVLGRGPASHEQD